MKFLLQKNSMDSKKQTFSYTNLFSKGNKKDSSTRISGISKKKMKREISSKYKKNSKSISNAKKKQSFKASKEKSKIKWFLPGSVKNLRNVYCQKIYTLQKGDLDLDTNMLDEYNYT